jgi:hypothetical protein
MTPRSSELGKAQRAGWFIVGAASLLAVAQIAGLRASLVAGIVILGFGPALAQIVDPEADAMSPRGLVAPFYTMFALGPLLIEGVYSDKSMLDYLVLQFLGLAGLRLGLAAAGRPPSTAWPSTAESWHRDARPLRVTAWLLLGMAVPSLITYVVALGGLQGIFEVGYGPQRKLILAESQLFGAGFEWALLGSTLLAFCGVKYGSLRNVWLGILGWLLVGGVLLATGQRNPIAYSAMFGLALFHFGRRRLSARATIGLIVVGMTVAQLFSVARFFLDDGLVRAIGAASVDVFENPRLLAPWAAAQFTVPPSSLLEVIEHGRPPLLLGRSYFTALLAALPFAQRLFVGSEPSLGEWRMQTFYPEAAAIGADYGFSPVTEAYMNFGTVGVPLVLFVYGLAISSIYRRVSRMPTPLGVLALAGSAPMLMLNGFTNQASALMYQWARGYLMPAILLAAVLVVTRKANVSHEVAAETPVESTGTGNAGNERTVHVGSMPGDP